jgi:hypothetical protein
VAEVPHDGRDPLGRVFADVDPDHVLARLRVYLFDGHVWVAGEELGDLGLEVSEVVFGPFDLAARSLQAIGPGHGPDYALALTHQRPEGPRS